MPNVDSLITEARHFWIRWSALKGFGSSRVLRTSYFWLLFVPIVAKVVVNLDDVLTFTVYGQPIKITLGLPFSWKMFYFSAVCFSVAGILYSWRCHVLVKRYNSFTEYVQEGRGASHLRVYANELPGVPQEIHTLLLRTDLPAGLLSERENSRDLADAFWALRNIADHSDRLSLVLTAALYALGFGLLFFVLFQNFVFVIRATL